jgi:hypothetical protein
MKELMEFDFEKFIERLKEMSLEHGHTSLGEDSSNKDMRTVKGYQDCLEDVIEAFKECMA